MDVIVYIYQYAIFVYSIAITTAYLTLSVLGFIAIRKKKTNYTIKEEQLFTDSPEVAPGISIVAPAFNEEVIIIDNVTSLLNLDYPKFEVVVVNDGSKDRTLELLIERFELQEVSMHYTYKVRCRRVRRLFKSVNPEYDKLIVVDKENGGTKADAMNAGVNIIQYDYFINTDVDCLLARNTLKKVIMPVLDSNVPVIAVGATMRMVNGCEVEDGVITRVRPPNQFVPLFQETEYLRSYLVAKMGWSTVNAIPNVSGGFGLFNTQVVINTGGFDPLSHAEDMDMTIRMRAYMYDRGVKHKIDQIPETCCWTQGPPNIKILKRQRTRWGRGLMQIFILHGRYLFKRKYGKMGFLVLPYAFIFEFLAPIVEFTGILFLIYLLYSGQVNFNTFWLLMSFVYLIGITTSMITITYDFAVQRQYKTLKEYFKLMLFSALEAFLYHPFVVIFSLAGYIQYFTRKNFKWGAMTRQGFSKKQ
ncbi:MAG: glycosyltransferase [Lentimicrobiaceae bacterium]|nr:glycosyltransferase [Lentimicrobiaceae bacterium]